VKRSRRGHGTGAKRLDLTDLRKLMEDRRMWCVLARVELHDGEVAHFELTADELLVDVVTIPSGIELRCRMPGTGGLWQIPAVGTEVYVGIPDGLVDFVPGIVAVLGTPGESLSEDVVVLAVPPGAQLLIHDGNGGDAYPLATKDDVDQLAAYVDRQFDPTTGHVHVVSGAATTSMVEGTASAGVTTVPAAAGTSVLKAK